MLLLGGGTLYFTGDKFSCTTEITFQCNITVNSINRIIDAVYSDNKLSCVIPSYQEITQVALSDEDNIQINILYKKGDVSYPFSLKNILSAKFKKDASSNEYCNNDENCDKCGICGGKNECFPDNNLYKYNNCGSDVLFYYS